MATRRKSAQKTTKKGSKKSKASPSKRKAASKAARKAPARKAPARKAARKAPARKAARKAPARKAARKAARRAPARKAAPRKAARKAAARTSARVAARTATARPTTKAKAARATKPVRPVAKTVPGKRGLGRFVWHDLMTTDVARSVAFYGRVFGWTSRAMDMGPMGTYTILSAGGVDLGGMMALGASGGHSHWMSYIAVPDLDAACKTAERAGGAVCAPPIAIPGVGRFAVVADPAGAVSSPFEMEQDARAGIDEPAAVGLVAWNELLTPEPARVGAFYERVYGWTLTDMNMGPMGKYYVFKSGDRDVAGMMQTPPNAPPGPPQWLGYVNVQDVDGTLDAAVASGADVGASPFDVAGVGRLAIFTDPTGAMIALFRPQM